MIHEHLGDERRILAPSVDAGCVVAGVEWLTAVNDLIWSGITFGE